MSRPRHTSRYLRILPFRGRCRSSRRCRGPRKCRDPRKCQVPRKCRFHHKYPLLHTRSLIFRRSRWCHHRCRWRYHHIGSCPCTYRSWHLRKSCQIFPNMRWFPRTCRWRPDYRCSCHHINRDLLLRIRSCRGTRPGCRRRYPGMFPRSRRSTMRRIRRRFEEDAYSFVSTVRRGTPFNR